ncbi:hypothetical protein BH10BDE1_BH10BDE1_07940 [soil metagenome]
MSVAVNRRIVASLKFLTKHKYIGVRIVSGLFAAHFFANYFYLMSWFYIFRSKTEPNALNGALIELGQENSVLILRILLALLFGAAMLFTTGRWVRISALVVWVGYTLFYNFLVCINQPFITYFIHILMTYIFLSNEPFFRIRGETKPEFVGRGFLFVLALVYMTQVTISGLSKALSPEWRAGDILGLMLTVHDPEPGLRFLGFMPSELLKIATWLTLILECGSLLYIFVPRLRIPIWAGHVVMYAFIILFVPHATHVALVMIVFQWLILDDYFIGFGSRPSHKPFH